MNAPDATVSGFKNNNKFVNLEKIRVYGVERREFQEKRETTKENKRQIVKKKNVTQFFKNH